MLFGGNMSEHGTVWRGAGRMGRRTLGALGALLLAAPARAQGWPPRSVRVVVPYPPGGPTDVLARLVAERLQAEFGQSFVVENRGGGAAVPGTDHVAKAAPDGLTLLVNTQQPMVMNQAMMRALPHDPIRDFAPIAHLGRTPHVLVVPAGSDARTLEALVAAGKTTPGGLSFGSSSVGSASHLIGEAFARSAGFPATHVPYRGAAPALTDLLGGRLAFMAFTYATVSQQIAAGQLRPLAAATARRMPELPDVPTLVERGFPLLDADAWFGLWAPRGTPETVLNALNRAVEVMLAEPSMRTRLEGMGFLLMPMERPVFAAYVEAEATRWAALIATTGITIEP